MAKVFAVVALLILIRLSNSQSTHNGKEKQRPNPITEAIDTINPELDKITQRLRNMKLSINKSLLKASMDIHYLLGGAGETILKQIETTQKAIESLQKQEFVLELDIQNCLDVKDRKIHKLITVANTKIGQNTHECNANANNFTTNANDLIKELDNLEMNVNKIIGYCIRNNNLPWQVDNLNSCMFNETILLNQMIDTKYNQTIQSHAIGQLCNLSAFEAIPEQFQNVEQVFKQCLKGATRNPNFKLIENKSAPVEIEEQLAATAMEKGREVKGNESSGGTIQDNLIDRILKLIKEMKEVRITFEDRSNEQNNSSELNFSV